jgi:asparagine synthase (glutamine-hydrolysing)
MCGIAGVLSDRPAGQIQTAVGRMIAYSRHRGPDGSGEVVIPLGDEAGRLVLGHTRLSIIDLSELSSQPMKDVATNSWLSYNGEIYNFRELRAELADRGVMFATKGDSEVLLKSLVHWGRDALGRFEGMFAFAFWDGARQELLLGRDPLGIKPLYYFRKPGVFMFSSELRALRESGLHDFALDRNGLDSYLTFGAVIGPATVLKDARELVPGHGLVVRNAAVDPTTFEYWSIHGHLSARRQQEKPDFPEAVQRTKRLLKTAVGSQLVSDVPVGIFLSGGIDSGLVARLAAEEQRDNLTLLTVGFEEEEFSEVKEAQQTARQIQIKHQVVHVPNADFKKILPEALSSVDQPTVDGMNTFVISRAAASVGLKVLLSGLGGDELFGGYTTFLKVPRLYRYHKLLRILSLAAGIGTRNRIQWEKIREIKSLRSLGDAYLLQRCIRWRQLPYYLEQNDWGALSSLFDLWDEVRRSRDDFSAIAFMELSFYMRNQLLRDTDVAGMANSVEIRVPFLDLSVVKAALDIPGSSHIDMWGGKKITRSILDQMSQGQLSRQRKMGFLFPWKIWLRGPLSEMISETLHEKKLYHPLSMDFSYGERILKAFHRQDPIVSWYEVWSLFVLLDWQRRNKVGDVAA